MGTPVTVQFFRAKAENVKMGYVGNVNISFPGVTKIRGRIAKSNDGISYYTDCRCSSKIEKEGQNTTYANNVELEPEIQKTVDYMTNAFLMMQVFSATGEMTADGFKLHAVEKSLVGVTNDVADKIRKEAVALLGNDISPVNSEFAQAALAAVKQARKTPTTTESKSGSSKTKVDDIAGKSAAVAAILDS